MADVEIIGVPFDGYGRPGHQSRAAAALRAAGLADAWSAHTVVADGDIDLPDPTPNRGEATSLINEAALLAMVEGVGQQVSDAVHSGVFPVVVGGDCSTLLGTIPALRDDVGLFFVDGHEDTMPLDVSEDGEAANTEIGLLLGLTGKLLAGPLAERLPALTRDRLFCWGRATRTGDISSTSAPFVTTASGCATTPRWPRPGGVSPCRRPAVAGQRIQVVAARRPRRPRPRGVSRARTPRRSRRPRRSDVGGAPADPDRRRLHWRMRRFQRRDL